MSGEVARRQTVSFEINVERPACTSTGPPGSPAFHRSGTVISRQLQGPRSGSGLLYKRGLPWEKRVSQWHVNHSGKAWHKRMRNSSLSGVGCRPVARVSVTPGPDTWPGQPKREWRAPRLPRLTAHSPCPHHLSPRPYHPTPCFPRPATSHHPSTDQRVQRACSFDAVSPP